jgi:hypothetical protein
MMITTCGRLRLSSITRTYYKPEGPVAMSFPMVVDAAGNQHYFRDDGEEITLEDLDDDITSNIMYKKRPWNE